MNDLTNILLGLGVFGVLLFVCGVIVVGYFANAVKSIKSALLGEGAEKRDIGPQPFEVKKAPAFTQHHDFERLEAEFKDLRAERKRDVGDLHTRIDKLDREMGAMVATVNLNTDHLVRIEGKLDSR